MTDQIMACAVCARVLDYVVPEKNGVEIPDAAYWQHTFNDLPTDHPAVPVPYQDIDTATRCDFCSAEDPAWTVPATSFEAGPEVTLGTGEKRQYVSSGDWAACDICVEFIRGNQWNALRHHSLTRFVAMHGEMPPTMPDTLTRTWRQLRRAMTGPPYRHDEEKGRR